jgi:uroporphyrinogen decarboxylase
MDKRERMLSLLDPSTPPAVIPAAFFLHFPKECHRGQAAVDKHLEYFRYTGMDFVKVQYEHSFPYRPEIQTPDDWARMPLYGLDFYEEPLAVAEGLVKAARHEALVIVTLYSPFMCAGHTTSDVTITRHLQEDPEKVRRGLEAITESVLTFVRACVGAGVDGFYASTQGRESHRFPDPAIFDTYIKPYDLVVMRELERTCAFNILHICDYCGGYDDLSPFVDYPGHVINAPLHVGGRQVTGTEVARMFGRPYMGGLDRHGVIVTGSQAEIRQAVNEALSTAPTHTILGADCTVPGDISWDNLRTAIDAAHAFRA